MHDIPQSDSLQKETAEQPQLRQSLRDMQNPKSEETKEQKLERLLETRKIIAEAKSKEITFSQPILRQKEDAVFFPKTINVIQGKAGVHKSRLAETICSALLRKSDYNKDLLGFKADVLNRFAVVYVDTERNFADQLPYALQQIQKKAGYAIEDEVKDFDFISLLEFDREERFEMLNVYLEKVRKEFITHIFIVLDVVTDCISNFNDTKDSMKLIDMMNKSINHFDVTFLCLIHENPGNTDKARGHLGTEIMNKASTVIQVGFEKDSDQTPMDIIKVNYLKCRSSKKHEPFYVQYSDTEKGLVLASPEVIREAMDRKKVKADNESLTEYLATMLTEPTSKGELFEMLKKEMKCSNRTLEDRMKEIIESKFVFNDANGSPCILEKKLEDKKVIFFLTQTTVNDLLF